MDFERMGMAIGYRKTIDNLHAEACRKIHQANAGIDCLNALVATERKRHAAEVAELQREIRVLKGEPEPVIVVPVLDLAREAFEAVMAEPIRFTCFFGMRRIHWRRGEYRSVVVAERARARVAQTAYDAASAS